MDETSGSTPISTKLERIATLARQLRGQPLTTLAHHIDLDWLREAHRRTRKDGATGVDGQTADEYAAHLEENLRSLLERAKSGTYRAPPVRRAYIPKDSGGMRPFAGTPATLKPGGSISERPTDHFLSGAYRPGATRPQSRPRRNAFSATTASVDRVLFAWSDFYTCTLPTGLRPCSPR